MSGCSLRKVPALNGHASNRTFSRQIRQQPEAHSRSSPTQNSTQPPQPPVVIAFPFFSPEIRNNTKRTPFDRNDNSSLRLGFPPTAVAIPHMVTANHMAAPLRLALLALLLALALTSAYAGAGDIDSVASALSHMDKGLNNGRKSCGADGALVGDCIDEDEEMGMDSESARRVLASRNKGKYISYGALSKDRVPCNRRGASYYNCNRRGKVNPYRRSCTVITRCARTIS